MIERAITWERMRCDVGIPPVWQAYDAVTEWYMLVEQSGPNAWRTGHSRRPKDYDAIAAGTFRSRDAAMCHVTYSVGIRVAPGHYRYIVSSTGGSSDRYGECVVCGKHASEVFIQTEEVAFPFDALDAPLITHATNPDGVTYTQHGCRSAFGHAECLASIRKDGAP